MPPSARARLRRVHAANSRTQLDATLAQQQAAIYAVAGIDEAAPAAPAKQKRKKVYTSNEADEDAQAAKKAKPEREPRKNTAVYVTQLPPDTTEAELKDVFSRCGVISEEIDGGKPRIKLYRNDDGSLKGDALIVYFRPESVSLAIQMLDDSPLRLDARGAGPIKVQAADFSLSLIHI